MRRKTKLKIAAASIAFLGFVAMTAPSSETKAKEPVASENVMPEVSYEVIENATLSHYCICEKCCGKPEDHPAYGITKSGRKAEPYLSVAVDPDVIPLDSTVYIEYADGTVRECRADDTGGLVKGAHVDLCVTDHQEGRKLGKQTVAVYWTEEESTMDNFELWKQYNDRQEKELAQRPVCSYCDQHIQDEYCYEINDVLICHECLKAHFRVATDDYIE